MAAINLSGSFKNTPQNQFIRNYGSPHNDGFSQFSLQTDLKLGYFIASKLCIGFNPQIDFIKYKSKVTTAQYGADNDTVLGVSAFTAQTTSKLLSINPFIRLYAIRHKSIGVFVETSGGITLARITESNKIENVVKSIETSILSEQKFSRYENIFNFKFGLGFNYFLSERAALECSFNYQDYQFKKLRGSGLFKNNYAIALGFGYFF